MRVLALARLDLTRDYSARPESLISSVDRAPQRGSRGGVAFVSIKAKSTATRDRHDSKVPTWELQVRAAANEIRCNHNLCIRTRGRRRRARRRSPEARGRLKTKSEADTSGSTGVPKQKRGGGISGKEKAPGNGTLNAYNQSRPKGVSSQTLT